MRYKIAQASIIAEASNTMASIDETSVSELLSTLQGADKIFFIGVGRVKLALEGIAKRLAHLGLNTVVVGQITEPAITEKDVLVVGSGSGESAIPLAIAKKAKELGATVVHIGSNPNSSMNNYSELFVRIPVQTKLALPGEIQSKQPMTSLFEQCLLLLGDAIAMMLLDESGASLSGLWKFHANLE